MGDRHQQQDPSDIAAEWFARRHDTDFSQDEQRQFQQWLDAAESHRSAYQRMETIWQRYAQVPASSAPVIAAGARPHARLGRPRLRRVAALAACLLAAVTALIMLPQLPVAFADYRTEISQRKQYTLPDGSAMELAGNTALSIDFGRDRREIRLHRGRAHFEVAADPQRPFVVVAADGSTRALGTAFEVARLDDASVKVAVTEHAVEVAASGARIDVGSGYRVQYGASGIGAPEPIDPTIEFAWRRDRLAFRKAPLGEVIQALERHRRGYVLVTDADLATLPVTAVFDIRQSDAALDTIADTLPVRIRRFTDYLVLVSPAG